MGSKIGLMVIIQVYILTNEPNRPAYLAPTPNFAA